MSRTPDLNLEDIEGREHGPRSLQGPAAFVVTGLAFAWSVFQILVAQIMPLSADIVRAVHLAFALSLVFLCYPVFRKAKGGPAGDVHNLPWWDAAAAVLAALAALYIIIDREGVATRIGNPLPRDLLAGSLLIILLLDAARRSVGPALPSVATFFIVYSVFSEHFPGVMATMSTPWSRVVQTLSLGSQGIYGIPLGVSASTVFLFVLFGALLEKAGGGQYFIDLAYSILGGFRGGPAKASVLASGLTGMINGSSIANTVTTGTFTIPLMKRAGYPAVKAGAIEVAASTNGQLMPPIMGAAAFIIAETCNLPYAAVVKAAFLPAAISYVALIYITHLEAVKLGLEPLPRSELPSFRKTLVGGLHFLIPLAVLIVQLIVLRRSAQLSAMTAILTLKGVILVKGILKEGRPGAKQAIITIRDGMVTGARNMVTIGVAVACAGVIVGTLSLGLSSQVTAVIDVLSGGTLIGMLLVTAVVSLILGMGLPTTATYIVMSSITAVAIQQLSTNLGYDFPLIAIHLFVFYFGILSDDTPPVALSAYAAAAISKGDPVKTGIQGFLYDIRTALLPFLFLFNTRLLLFDIQGPLHLIWVTLTSVAGMFAFAAATQGFLLKASTWWQTGLLLAATWFLLSPGGTETILPGWNLIGSLGGGVLFALVYFLQKANAAKDHRHG